MKAGFGAVAVGIVTWLLVGSIPNMLGNHGGWSFLFFWIVGPVVGFFAGGAAGAYIEYSEEGRQEQESLTRKGEERSKTFSKFQELVQELRPDWALAPSDNVALMATCRYEGETLELRIEWGSGSITDDGDLRPALPGYERIHFSIRSPSAKTFLLMESWNRRDGEAAWNQAAFNWFAEYGQNSAPLVDLRSRRLKLKRNLRL